MIIQIMSKEAGSIKTVKIAYYSGTGGTERVANCFDAAFKEEGYKTIKYHIFKGAVEGEEKYDLLLVLFAVHACNAPELVYKWIDNLQQVNKTPAVVVSVSGGGEVVPNTACRLSCKKRLKKKGYDVLYEQMLVMPSNWVVPTKEPIALLLLEVLPKRVRQIVKDISAGVVKKTRPCLIDRVFSHLGELEKIGAHSFGKRIKVTGDCNGCGVCSRSCPACNIKMAGNKPEFGNKCHLCLKCIYGCPKKALKPGIGKFVVIGEGYSLNELEKKLPFTEKVDIEGLTKGYLWSGVRKYLLSYDEK